jgi:hypothetical protein
MKDNIAAFVSFERLSNAVNGGSAAARIYRGSVFRKAKVASTKFRLAGQFNRIPLNSGFFTSAANAAIDNVPTWASCIEYIGLSLPLIACRANLVKVSRNLCRLSGKMSAMRIELTRPSALGLCIRSKDGEGSNAYLIAP